ncbi:STT3 domain-containing protein [Desulfovermiculus halophilus]|uniref:STT3 domain-containing protein n=1 Tax=Desulfovermiculus halophilus TaxID=339722 RepID=UPI0004855AC2|nr:STT3 domain-containing protein [Desulfovermiculus halophilus]
MNDRSRVILCIGIFIITYALTLGLRLYEAPAWDNPALSIQGEKLLATHDAYYWLAGAKDTSKNPDAALAQITGWVHAITGMQYGNLAFWLPVFVAPLAVIPLILLGRHWRLEEGALTAGVLTAGCLGFVLRTRLGFYDTDILALFFPLLVYVLLIMLFTPWLRSGWFQGKDVIKELSQENRMRFLLQSVGAGLIGMAYMWFYPNAGAVLLTSLGALVLCILVLAPSWRQTGWLIIGLLMFLGLSLGGPVSWLGVAALFWILQRKVEWQSTGKGLKWALIALGCIVVIDANILGMIWSGVMKVLGYAKIFSTDIRREGDLNLPMVVQSIREAQNIDWGGIIYRVAGHWAVFAAGLLGFGYVLYSYPLALIFVPMLGMALFSFALGNRFTMYGGAVLGLGLGFGLSLLLLRLHIRKSLRVVVQLALSLVVLLPTLEVASGLSPAPILPKPYAQTFLELKEKTPENARLWPWWDYGYAGQYYAERITFGDGGIHGGSILYPAARVHMTSSPRQARQMMQYITLSQREEFAANSTKYKNMNEFWKPYLADPVAGLEDMGPEGAKEFVRSLADKEYDWPNDLPPQYLVLSWENLRLAYWISFYGSWDLVTGQADPGRIQQVRGEVNFDLDKGHMELEGGTLELNGLDVVDHEDPKHFTWDSDTGIYGLLNRITSELYLMDEKIYNSMMVQMLIRNPSRFKANFELTVDNYPWNRAYRAKN